MDSRALIGLAILLVINQQVVSTSNICDSPRCVQEAAKIIDYVDNNTNPCDDFYQFACGQFVANTMGDEIFGLENRLAEHYMHNLQALYRMGVLENDHKMVKAAKKLYGGCMKSWNIKDDFLKTIKQTLKQVGGWPVLEGSSWNEEEFDWLNTTYKLRRLGYEYSAILDVAVAYDENNGDKRIFKVVSGARRYISSEDPIYMAEIAAYLGAENEKTAIKELNDVYEFLQKNKQLRSQEYSYVRETVEEYQKGENAIDWLQFINNVVGPKIQVTKNDKIYFPNKENLKQFQEFISETPKRTLANSIIWEAIQPLIPFIPNCPGRHRMCSCREKREDFCVSEVHLKLITEVPNPIDVLRLRRYLSEEKRKTIEDIVLKINSGYEETVKTVTWIPEEIKQKLTAKIKKIKVVVGLPGNYFDDKILDESDVDMGDVDDSPSFFTLLAQANRNRQSAVFLSVNRLRSEDNYGQHIIDNTVPTYLENDLLYIPIEAPKYFLYEEDKPEYLNHGTLGTMVGAALGELLLSHIKEEIKTGAVFSEIQKCLLLGLKNDTISDYFKENVVSTTIKNIISEHVSYKVYQEWVKTNGEEPKLVATRYTPNQLFWISATSLKCEALGLSTFDDNDYKHDKVKSSSYSVSESLRQNPNFAKDFNCPVNSRLNPAEKCDVI